MYGTVYEVNGDVVQVRPANGNNFDFLELQRIVGGMFEIITLPNTKEIMVLNEEGRINGMMQNSLATSIFQKAYPKDVYELNNPGTVHGTVLVCDSSMVL